MNIVILSALSALSACLTVAALKVFKRYFQGNVAGFARDPLMQRTMDQATQDGFEQGDDFFEITAAMRDTVLAKLTHLFSQSADVFEISALQTYIKTQEVQRLRVEMARSAAFAVKSLDHDPQASKLSDLLPPMPWKHTDQDPLEDIVAETIDMLRQEFGHLPDIPTIAAILLYLRSLPNTDTVYIALKSDIPISKSWMMALLMCHPHTGRPLVSTAEMSPEIAQDLQNMA